MPAARQYKPVFLISSRSKIPGMEIAAVAVGALFELTTELLCCFVCFRINSPVNLQSNLDVMGREMNSLMDRSKEVIDEKEVAEKEGNEIRSQVLKWLDDVEKLYLRVNQIREEVVDNKKPSRCSLNCSKRNRAVSREVQEVLEVIKNLPEAGTFHSGGVAYKTSIIKDKCISKDKDEKKTVQIESTGAH